MFLADGASHGIVPKPKPGEEEKLPDDDDKVEDDDTFGLDEIPAVLPHTAESLVIAERETGQPTAQKMMDSSQLPTVQSSYINLNPTFF